MYNFLDPEETELDAFCDSCSGQNKNHVIMKYFHHLVNKQRRLKKVTFIFPVRGHSYNECDKNAALIPQKTKNQLPDELLRPFVTQEQNLHVLKLLIEW